MYYFMAPDAHGYTFCSLLKFHRWYKCFVWTEENDDEDDDESVIDDDEINDYEDDSSSNEDKNKSDDPDDDAKNSQARKKKCLTNITCLKQVFSVERIPFAYVKEHGI